MPPGKKKISFGQGKGCNLIIPRLFLRCGFQKFDLFSIFTCEMYTDKKEKLPVTQLAQRPFVYFRNRIRNKYSKEMPLYEVISGIDFKLLSCFLGFSSQTTNNKYKFMWFLMNSRVNGMNNQWLRGLKGLKQQKFNYESDFREIGEKELFRN